MAPQQLVLKPPRDWQVFEDLCHALWEREWRCATIQKHGRSGQAQRGVDIYGKPDGGAHTHGIQCKAKSSTAGGIAALTIQEIRREVEQAKTFGPPPLKGLIIATTAESDVNIQASVRKLSEQHVGQGLFTIDVLAWPEIVARLTRHEDVLERFYHDASLRWKGMAQKVDEIHRRAIGGQASRNIPSRRPVIVPVTIKPLSRVKHLREHIISEHLLAWPRQDDCLDPQKWGHLGDPRIEPQTSGIPTTLVAVTSEDEYRGAVSIVPYDLTHELYRGLGPWMGGLLVHPNYRGKRIGESLVSECVQLAAAMGIEKLYLFTEGRDVGVDWYRGLGWRVHVVIPDFWDGHTNERRTVMLIRPSDIFPSATRHPYG
jgi:GNAT superfamily N-acetyltransferase